jgi:hypothetical protein
VEVTEPSVNIQFHQGLYFAMLMEGIKAIKNSYFHFRLLNDLIEHLWHLKGYYEKNVHIFFKFMVQLFIILNFQ